MRANMCAVAVLALVPMIARPAGSAAASAGHAQLPDLRSENVAVIALSPGGQVVATGERASLVKLWDGLTRRLDRTIRAHTAPVSSLAFSADGQLLASGSFDRWIRLWDVRSGRAVRALSGHPGHVKSLAFSRNGELLASTGADGVRVWDVSSGSLRRTFPSPRGTVAAVFSPAGGVLACGGGDGVRVWNVDTGALVRHMDAGGELVLALAFSPNGRWLVSGGTSRTAKLWDLKTGEPDRTLSGGGDFVRAVAFAGDGSTVVVADRTAARAWNIGTGAMRTMLIDTRFAVVALSSDGRALGAAAGDDAVKVLSLK